MSPSPQTTLQLVGFGHFGNDPVSGIVRDVEAIVRPETPQRVEFRLDGTLVTTDREWPYKLAGGAWDSRSVEDGWHTLDVTAFLSGGRRLEAAHRFRVERPEQEVRREGALYRFFVLEDGLDLEFTLDTAVWPHPTVGTPTSNHYADKGGVRIRRFVIDGVSYLPAGEDPGCSPEEPVVDPANRRAVVRADFSRFDARAVGEIDLWGKDAACQQRDRTVAFNAPIPEYEAPAASTLQRVRFDGRYYHVDITGPMRDIRFRLETPCQGEPDPTEIRYGNNGNCLEVERWLVDGKRFDEGGLRQSCMPGPWGPGPGAVKSHPENEFLHVRGLVSRADTRLEGRFTAEGHDDTCVPGGGEVVVDAPVNDQR
jgi:hypothetical protein